MGARSAAGARPRRPRGINCIHVDRGGTRCKSTSASRSSWSSPRHLGAAHLRGNVADVLGLDVAVLVALLRVQLLLQVGHLLDLLRGLAAGDDHRDRACIAMRVNASRSECIHTVMHMNAS